MTSAADAFEGTKRQVAFLTDSVHPLRDDIHHAATSTEHALTQATGASMTALKVSTLPQSFEGLRMGHNSRQCWTNMCN